MVTDTHTYKATTVNLAAHVRRGLIIITHMRLLYETYIIIMKFYNYNAVIPELEIANITVTGNDIEVSVHFSGTTGRIIVILTANQRRRSKVCK